MNYLAITLAGFAQYYYASKTLLTSNSDVFYKTERVPTKSALVGMVGAVLGIEKQLNRPKDFRDDLEYKYEVVKKGSTFIDYQIAGTDGGFYKVSGEKTSEKIIKRVEYLQDAEFIAYIGADDETLEKIYKAFLNPVYVPCLGKVCCFPSKPFVTEFNTLSEEELKEKNNVYDCP